MNKYEYINLYDEDETELQERVSERLKSGWELHPNKGYTNLGHHVVFYQSLQKQKESKD